MKQENKDFTKWEQNFLIAKQYFEDNGNLLVPCNYITKDNFPLGTWIQKQRSRYRYESNNSLTLIQIKMLEDIGMIWDIREYNWQNNYQVAKDFYNQNGHLKIPYECVIQDIYIGKWIHTQRKAYNHQGNCKITDEHIALLEDIGMIWDITELKWEEYYKLLVDYFKENGNINISSSYKLPTGEDIGYWLWNIKKDYKNGKLPQNKIKALESLHIIWHNPNNNAKIISWVINQEKRKAEVPTSMSTKHLNFISTKATICDISNEQWDTYYQLAKDFLDTHKINTIPPNLIIDKKYNVGKWFQVQRNLFKTKQLSPYQELKFKQLLRRNHNVASGK